MSQHSRTLAILAFGVAIAVSGLALTKQVIAVAGEADAERLNRAILMYIAEKNPQAPIKAFQGFPEILVAEAQRSNLDHCVSLAQAEVESEFRYDAICDRRQRTGPHEAGHRGGRRSGCRAAEPGDPDVHRREESPGAHQGFPGIS